MTKIRVAATVALLTLALGGCANPSGADSSGAPSISATSAAPSTPVETTTPSTSPSTQTASPTASPTQAAAAAPPALGDLTLSSAGLEYVKVGSPVPAHDDASAIVKWKQPFCEGADASGPGGWETQYPTVKHGNLAFYVEAKTKTSPVKVIYIISEKITTEHGLHIGSSLADVKKLGGKHAGEIDSSYDSWTISGGGGELVFFIQKDKVALLQVQEAGTPPVLAMEITPCA